MPAIFPFMEFAKIVNLKSNNVSANIYSYLKTMEQENMLDLPLIGQQTPDFEFEVYHEGKIKKAKLSDYKNKWIVMLFYPADFTFVCPTELTQAADLYKDFQKAGAEVISISTDTAFVHKAWHDQSPMIKKIKYPMAADPTGQICNA